MPRRQPGGLTVSRTQFHFSEHGTGRPVLVLHGAYVDRQEAEACFDPALAAFGGLRRIYPDLPGMGKTPAPPDMGSAADVLDALLGFASVVAGGEPYLLVGHSAGGYYAQAMASRSPSAVAGLALVCPLLPGVRDVPPHRAVVGAGDLGDRGFRDYFVVQTPEMLERYERYVAPGAALADAAALERIGAHWRLAPGPAYDGPMLVVAGRCDSVVGYAAAVDLIVDHPHATVAVVEDAGHALPHERPELMAALLADWLGQSRRDR